VGNGEHGAFGFRNACGECTSTPCSRRIASALVEARSPAIYGWGVSLAYLLNSVHREDGIKVTDYVVPVMAAVIVNVFGKNLSDEAIIKRLALAATLRGARNSVGRITTGRFQTVLRTTDLADPVLRELQTNNCFDWSPRTKLCLICLESDGIVVPENTHKALKAMRARRVGPETLQEFVIHDPSLNHATALVPSLAQARRFFDKQR